MTSYKNLAVKSWISKQLSRHGKSVVIKHVSATSVANVYGIENKTYTSTTVTTFIDSPKPETIAEGQLGRFDDEDITAYFESTVTLETGDILVDGEKEYECYQVDEVERFGEVVFKVGKFKKVTI